MAGRKKQPEQTAEEKLQQALVPEAEQPYKVPDNWCWVKAGTVIEIYNGNSINEKVKAEKYYGQKEGLIFIGTKDVGFDNVINYETNVKITDYQNFKIAPANTALLCIEGGSSGKKIGFVTQDVCFGNKLCAFASKKINPKFIFYLLQTQCFVDQFNNKRHGLIGGVSIKDLSEMYFMLPPLAEQQRIVERIETLFAKLDEAKEKLQNTLDTFETRKAAILHKAFNGELTANWRKQHGLTLDSWEEKLLKDIVNGFKYGTSEKSDYKFDGTPVFRIPNITDNGLSFEDLKFLSHNDIDVDNQVLEDDILIIRSNGSRDLVGKCVIVPQLNRIYTYASFLIRIRTGSFIKPKFLVKYLNSKDAKVQMFNKAKSSAGINNINSRELGEIRIYLPTVNEQTEIVRIIDNMLAKEQQAHSVAQNALAQIDLIKKSILARAFRGQLATNNPTDEPAVKLLERVL